MFIYFISSDPVPFIEIKYIHEEKGYILMCALTSHYVTVSCFEARQSIALNEANTGTVQSVKVKDARLVLCYQLVILYLSLNFVIAIEYVHKECHS